jgi:hypothetical protein
MSDLASWWVEKSDGLSRVRGWGGCIFASSTYASNFQLHPHSIVSVHAEAERSQVASILWWLRKRGVGADADESRSRRGVSVLIVTRSHSCTASLSSPSALATKLRHWVTTCT